MERYAYPDADDAHAAALIAGSEPYPGYWQASEDLVIDRVRRQLGGMARGRFLDAGCGQGRLIPRFQDLFERVVAIEPDAGRLAVAVRRADELGLASSVRLVNVGVEDFEAEQPFDFVLCSHVIQHVDTAALPRIFAALERLLAPDGLLAIMTAHATASEDRFARGFLAGGAFREAPVDEAEFNRLVRGEEATLPTHFFSRDTLRGLLERHGMAEREFWCYHSTGDFGELERFVHRDLIVNAVPRLQERMGRDLYLAASRRTEGSGA